MAAQRTEESRTPERGCGCELCRPLCLCCQGLPRAVSAAACCHCPRCHHWVKVTATQTAPRHCSAPPKPSPAGAAAAGGGGCAAVAHCAAQRTARHAELVVVWQVRQVNVSPRACERRRGLGASFVDASRVREALLATRWLGGWMAGWFWWAVWPAESAAQQYTAGWQPPRPFAPF